MDANELIESKYVKASNLKGKPQTVTIREFAQEEIGQDKQLKGVLYFEGKEKGLVLNKTKITELMTMFGAETDGWIGQKITLSPGRTQYQGKMVDTIYVEGVTKQLRKPDPEPDHDDEDDFR